MKGERGAVDRLRRRKQRIRAGLPPFGELLRGSFYERSIRCGKPACHCARGEGHPVAYLSVTLPGPRTEQVTVPPHLRPLVRRWVANYLRWWRAIEHVSTLNRGLLRRRLLVPPARSSRRPR